MVMQNLTCFWSFLCESVCVCVCVFVVLVMVLQLSTPLYFCVVLRLIPFWQNHELPSQKLTVRTCQWMVGILSRFLLGPGLFSGANLLLVSGRVIHSFGCFIHLEKWPCMEKSTSLPGESFQDFLSFKFWKVRPILGAVVGNLPVVC